MLRSFWLLSETNMISRYLYWFLSSKKFLLHLHRQKNTSGNRPKLGILWGFSNIYWRKKEVGDHIYGYNLLQDKKEKIMIYAIYVIPHISNRILDFFENYPLIHIILMNLSFQITSKIKSGNHLILIRYNIFLSLHQWCQISIWFTE